MMMGREYARATWGTGAGPKRRSGPYSSGSDEEVREEKRGGGRVVAEGERPRRTTTVDGEGNAGRTDDARVESVPAVSSS